MIVMAEYQNIGLKNKKKYTKQHRIKYRSELDHESLCFYFEIF